MRNKYLGAKHRYSHGVKTVFKNFKRPDGSFLTKIFFSVDDHKISDFVFTSNEDLNNTIENKIRLHWLTKSISAAYKAGAAN